MSTPVSDLTRLVRLLIDAIGAPVQGEFTPTGGGITIPVAVNISTSAYSAGHSFGYSGSTTTDGWKFVDSMREDGGSGIIHGLSLFSLENIKPTGTLYIFSEAPTATFTDRANLPTWSASDDSKCIGRILVGDVATDWKSIGTQRAVFTKSNLAPMPVRCSQGKDLYGVFELDNAGGVDYSAATQFYAYLGVGQF